MAQGLTKQQLNEGKANLLYLKISNFENTTEEVAEFINLQFHKKDIKNV